MQFYKQNIGYWCLAFLMVFTSCREEIDAPMETCRIFKVFVESPDPAYLVEEYEYDTQDKLLKLIHYQPDGNIYNTTRFQYDQAGQLEKIFTKIGYFEDFLHKQYDASITYRYDNKGNAIEYKINKIVNGKDSLEAYANLEYNDQNKVIKIKHNGSPSRYTRFEYDNQGNIIKTFQNLRHDRPEVLISEVLSWDKSVNSNYLDKSLYLHAIYYFNRGDKLSRNHPAVMKKYDSYNSVTTTEATTYQYNHKGDVAFAVRTVSATNGPDKVYKLRYEYQCK